MFEDPPSKDWSIIPDNWDSLTTKFYEWLKVKGKVSHSVVSDSFVTPWTVAHQAPLTMGFSRQEYWSRWPFPSPGDLPSPGMEPGSPALLADSLPSKPLVVPISYPRVDGLFLWEQLERIGSQHSGWNAGSTRNCCFVLMTSKILTCTTGMMIDYGRKWDHCYQAECLEHLRYVYIKNQLASPGMWQKIKIKMPFSFSK